MKKPQTVVGIGEILWDLFPTGPRLGGAPLNFCYHCQQLGAQGVPASAIGTDELGVQLRAVLLSKDILDDYVVDIPHYPTGTVQVTLDDKGKPTYTIREDVAWDCIPPSACLDSLSRQATAVCYGSLAQRHHRSRETIVKFLKTMKPAALKIFDINLRQSFYSLEVLQTSLSLCTILKLSDEELPVLAGLYHLKGSVEKQLKILIEEFQLQLIAYTRGSGGSLLMTPHQSDDHPGYRVKTVNTVGAGDSFAAALCMGLLYKKHLSEVNEQANRVASLVCLSDSATPELPEELIEGMNHAS